MNARKLIAIAGFVTLTLAGGAPASRAGGDGAATGGPPRGLADGASAREGAAALGRLPRYFVENRGQIAGDTAYVFRTGGATAHFTERGVRYDLVAPRREPARRAGVSPREDRVVPVSFGEEARPRASVGLSFVGASASRPQGLSKAPTVYNFHTGARSTWRSDVPTFERVVYRELWPGVDLVYETTATGLKYSFELAAGADPALVRLAYTGASDVWINDAGQLVVSTRAGELRDDRPVVYQEIAGERVSVAGAYTSEAGPGGEYHVGFRLGAYDRARPLVIDPPVLVYSGFVGRDSADQVTAIALGPGGVAYVAGHTDDAPVVDLDGFVARISADGTQLLTMTIFGGSKTDYVWGLAVDPSGNSYVAGQTGSADLPIVDGFDATCGADGSCDGMTDAFMMKLDPDGAILYSTYIGGSGIGGETALGIAVDSQRRALVVGMTTSDDFPTLNALFPLKKGFEDGFVIKLDPDASGAASREWSTFLGGSGNDGLYAVATDAARSVYVTGYAGVASNDYPLVNPVQGNAGGSDVVVTKIKGDGSVLTYSTYLGGDSDAYEMGFGIAVDASGNAYVTGLTASKGYPTTPGSLQPQCVAVGLACVAGQAFVTKLGPLGQLLYSTFLGGTAGPTTGEGIALDASGRAYVIGTTQDPTYPTTLDALDGTCGFDGACDGVIPMAKSDAFVAVLNPSGSALTYSSFLGGHDVDEGSGIAVGAPGVMYLAGTTGSDQSLGPVAAFPTTPAAWNTTLHGNRDGFVAKLHIGADLAVTTKDAVDPVKLLSGSGGVVRYAVEVKNHGPQQATSVQVPLTFEGKVVRSIESVQLTPSGIGACFVVAGDWVSCSIGQLQPGIAAVVRVDVKVLALLGGKSQVLTAKATATAVEPDAKPLNNQDSEQTLIKK
jgi:hypothetical protein